MHYKERVAFPWHGISAHLLYSALKAVFNPPELGIQLKMGWLMLYPPVRQQILQSVSFAHLPEEK